MPCGVGAGRTAEPLAEFAGEMGIVAKAAGIGDIAERPVRAQHHPSTHQMRGMIQAQRIDQFTARRAARRAELLDIAQRDPGRGGGLYRPEVRVGKTLPDDAADAREQLVGRTGDRRPIGRHEQGADEIIDRQLQVRIGHKRCRSVALVGIPDKVEEEPPGASSLPGETTFELESEVGQDRLPRQPKGQHRALAQPVKYVAERAASTSAMSPAASCTV